MSRSVTRVVIMGAAGRDFHNFNVVYRDDPDFEVVAFTAAQIPAIVGRRYPPALAGARYPDGIPIVAENALETVCRDHGVGQVVFAYSDVAHARVMHLASRALAAGADFVLLGPDHTMLRADVPVIAVSAVRTGCGKSQTARWIAKRLRGQGRRVAVIRHPMPYGDLESQAVQRFAAPEDLAASRCTIEEREEYEPHIAAGNVVYAGVDYARIVAAAQQEAEVIVWDGGNNDFPFVRPDLHIVLVDPLRAGDETLHHPGEAVLRMADVIVIAKTDAAAAADIQRVTEAARRINAHARTVRAASPIRLDDPEAVRDKQVLVVEDGPSTTHGGMPYGAGYVAAIQGGAAAIVHPRAYVVPELAALYTEFPHLGPVLPAMGYSLTQLEALAQSIAAAPADVVVSGTPIDLAGLVSISKPVVRARYEFAEAEWPGLGAEIDRFVTSLGLAASRDS